MNLIQPYQNRFSIYAAARRILPTPRDRSAARKVSLPASYCPTARAAAIEVLG